jgi:arabinan endo-1,5-alpha-L-arabinosidase
MVTLSWIVAAMSADLSAGAVATGEITLRDPFIVPVREEGKYYLYGTRPVPPSEPGFEAYVSADLEAWHGPMKVFHAPPDFWADRDFWAPEVHLHNGRYYLFASFKAEGKSRGTQILVADKPEGPFKLHSDGPVTPRDWECLDGTLYLDKEGRPWIVFCHEWVQVGDGEICALQLSDDLKRSVGEPELLFKASEASWVVDMNVGKGAKVTDGPFLYRAGNGELLMLWASFIEGKRYAEGVARSESGTIHGPWKQDPVPLFSDDGGHAMLFHTFEGKLMLTLHRPNKWGAERVTIFPVSEKDGALTLGEP